MQATVIKLFPSGAWEVCAIINGRLMRRVFYGHTKREAIAAFRWEARKC